MSAVDDILAMRDKQAAPSFSGAMGHAGRAVARGMESSLGGALAGGVGAGLAGAAVTGIGMGAQQLYDAVSKARDFRTMMGSSFNADLHEFQQTRPTQFNEAYNSLRSMNPAVTKDPMTAGHYMRRMMEFQPNAAGGVILESLGASKEIPKDSPFSAFQRSGAQAAASAMKGRGGPRKGEEAEGEQQGEREFQI